MKKIILLTVLILGMSLPSCLDVLDVAPDGNLTMDEVVANPNKIAALLSDCYNQIPAFGWMFVDWENLFAACSDDAWTPAEGLNFGNSYNGQANASYHMVRDVYTFAPESNNSGCWWDRYWQEIRKCSQVIELVDKSPVSEADKRLYKAEAKVLRAWFYLELVKFFGKLPVLDGLVPYDADFTILKREPVYDVVTKRIAADCDDALATAELPWRIDNVANDQRTTKSLAHAIKATAYLFAASPLHNEGNNYWEEAYQVCRTAVNELKANGYQLHAVCTEPAIFGTGDEAAFYQLVCRSMDIPQARDRETIWQKRSEWTMDYYNTRGWYLYYIGSDVPETYGTSACPSQELVDAFETRNGEPILDLRQPYLDERHLQPNFRPGTGYSDQNPYTNRDPRFYATALYNGAIISWANGLPLTIESYEGGAHSINFTKWNVSRTGYFHRKMIVPGASPTNSAVGPRHKYFRLAEIILSAAEAAAEAGHLVEAKAYVDEVRDRVKMPPLPQLAKEDLILRIRNERRVELAYENQRYFDMRRWQTPDGNIESLYKWATGMLIRKQPNGSFTYQRVNTRSTERSGYESKDLLLPIPLSEAALLESVTGDKWQNPGW